MLTFPRMNLPNNLFIRSKINFPLEIKDDEDECSLETVENNEWIPEDAHFQEGSQEAEQPSQTH